MIATPTIVFPGEKLTKIESVNGETIIGPGLIRSEDNPNTLSVTQPGKLYFKSPNFYWVESIGNRYIPKRGDLVVGIVVKKAGDHLKVDLGCAEMASLSMLAFEGATKKQKPDVQVGDVIYAKVLNAYREMEPELVCIDQYYKAGNLGVLPTSGFLCNLSAKTVRKLLSMDIPLLTTLGTKFPYQICVGVNNKVWIDSQQNRHVLTVLRALKSIENYSDEDVIKICNQHK